MLLDPNNLRKPCWVVRSAPRSRDFVVQRDQKSHPGTNFWPGTVDLHVQLTHFQWVFAFKTNPVLNCKPLVFSA
jgi:hypothetical protein